MADVRIPATAPTASPQAAPAEPAPRPVVGAVRALERTRAIDTAGRPLEALARTALRSRAVAEGLRGAWLGHALHPLLTDFPLGAWASASFLDLFGGDDARPAARRLVGFGLLASLPTVASGLAEWQTVGGRGARRVGVVHAAVNSTATVLYGCSWLARRRGAHARAVALGLGGGVVATVGGWFGGHLTLVRKLGTADPAFGSDPAS
jgi:hypothetical protein